MNNKNEKNTKKPIFVYFIKAYRYILSPFVGQHCRFHPSCSHYAEEAIIIHGTIKGSYLMVRRLLRCHPWNEGGYDPVPEKRMDNK